MWPCRQEVLSHLPALQSMGGGGGKRGGASERTGTQGGTWCVARSLIGQGIGYMGVLNPLAEHLAV